MIFGGAALSRDATALARSGESPALAARLVNFMNPTLVVIAGGVARFGHPLLAEVRQTVYRQSTPLATSNLPIVLSELGDSGGVVGALVTASDELFLPA